MIIFGAFLQVIANLSNVMNICHRKSRLSILWSRYLSCLPDYKIFHELTLQYFFLASSVFTKIQFLFSIPHSWRICRFNLKTVANSQTATAKVLVAMGLFTTIRPPQWWVACKCTKCLPRRSSKALTTTIKIRTLLLQTLQIRISNTSTRKYKTIWWTWASTRTDTLITNQIHHNLCHRTWGKIPVLFLDIKKWF